ncbi:hypothetical protein GTY65_03465 [Streptomyces sp. SID8379]|uniref:hypothetical protein n=1 Tax=unclassified Streptomyces TaxID=2593676 RepID=UPI00037C4603|nr:MULTISPECIES: hypothetical protein [unclassified Streptomyces]MYW63143.1 hypothetical protein [Streptomyces sp. SID8379]
MRGDEPGPAAARPLTAEVCRFADLRVSGARGGGVAGRLALQRAHGVLELGQDAKAAQRVVARVAAVIVIGGVSDLCHEVGDEGLDALGGQFFEGVVSREW